MANYEKNLRFKKCPQLPGAGRKWAGHHHGSHTPTSTGAILLSKWPFNPNILAASVYLLQKLGSEVYFGVFNMPKS